MNPTQEQLDNRIRATGQVPVVSATDLINPPKPISIPQNLPTYTPTPVQIPSSLFALQDSVADSRRDLTSAITAEPSTAVQARIAADAQLGIPDLQKKVSDYQALDDTYAARLSNVASNELKQNIAGDLATNYAPLNSAISSRNTRQNIQEQQNINILRATNAAASAAATGRLALAEEWKRYAVEEATAQAKANVEAKRLIYEDNKQLFTAAEQRDYEARIKKEEREYEQMREDKTQRMNLVTTLGSFGVSQEITNRIMDADDISQALKIAAPYMQSPESKVQIEKMYLDMQLTKEQIATARTQRAQIGQPTAAEAKEITAQSNLQRSANDRANKVNSLINEIKNHPAYSTGTGVSSYVLAGNYNVRDFNKKVEQLRALLAIDAIKDFKGTGPMSDREFATAGAAATALNPTGKKSFFTDELTKIQASMNAVLDETATSLISADERDFIYSGGITNQSALPAQSFYDN